MKPNETGNLAEGQPLNLKDAAIAKIGQFVAKKADETNYAPKARRDFIEAVTNKAAV